MTNTQNSKKNVKQSKPSRKNNAKSVKTIPAKETKMRGESKQAMLTTLLKRPGGATIDEMAKVTGWQRHSVRGVISGVLKKRFGLSISSEKEERGRVYRIAV